MFDTVRYPWSIWMDVVVSFSLLVGELVPTYILVSLLMLIHRLQNVWITHWGISLALCYDSLVVTRVLCLLKHQSVKYLGRFVGFLSAFCFCASGISMVLILLIFSVVDSLSDSPIDLGPKVEHLVRGISTISVNWIYL